MANIVLSTGFSHRIQSSQWRTIINNTRLTHQSAKQSAQQSARSNSPPERAFQERVQEISQVGADPYPRLATDARTLSCGEFRSRYAQLANNESVEEPVVVSGRSHSRPLHLAAVYLD